jgi:hypothetical protein
MEALFSNATTTALLRSAAFAAHNDAWSAQAIGDMFAQNNICGIATLHQIPLREQLALEQPAALMEPGDTPLEIEAVCKAFSLLTLIGIVIIGLMFTKWQDGKDKRESAISKRKSDQRTALLHSGYQVVESDSGGIVAIRTNPYAPPKPSSHDKGGHTQEKGGHGKTPTSTGSGRSPLVPESWRAAAKSFAF